jgi:hypothetical protein
MHALAEPVVTSFHSLQPAPVVGASHRLGKNGEWGKLAGSIGGIFYRKA